MRIFKQMTWLFSATTWFFAACYYDNTPPESIAKAESFINLEVYELPSNLQCTVLLRFQVMKDGQLITKGQYLPLAQALQSDASGRIIHKIYLANGVETASLRLQVFCDIDGNGIFNTSDKAMRWTNLAQKSAIKELIDPRTQNFLAKANYSDFQNLVSVARSDSTANARHCVYLPQDFPEEFSLKYTLPAADFIHFLAWGASEGGSKNIFTHPDAAATINDFCQDI